MTRKIKLTLKSIPTLEGAGVRLRRAFGYNEVPLFDPFLLLDHFGSDDPNDYLAGFPWHPHRGIETITYMIKGEVAHGDSLGNEGVINSGDCQWMTAGCGIIHQEMPHRTEDHMMGFQLWANLPASEKMMEPRYRDVKEKDIPIVRLDDKITIKIVSGRIGETEGPVKDIITEPEYFDVHIEKDAEFIHKVTKGHTVFAYIFEGEAYFDDKKENTKQVGDLVLYGDGDEIKVTTEHKHVRFILVSGKPIGEPVAWRGPIVMNTQEELITAFREYQEGTFIKT